MDRDLRSWEAFATTGAGGLPEPGRIVFRCTTDPAERPRVVQIEGDKARAEQRLLEGTQEELLRMLGEAGEVR